jgi:carbamoyltransferase
MLILGINAYHGDSSACLLRDGVLVAAVEEERFRRLKHWAGFPSESIRYCLEHAGVGPGELDHIAINRDPHANLGKKVLFTLAKRPKIAAIVDRLMNASKVKDVRHELAVSLGVDPSAVRAQVHNVEHHRAHLASSFLVSPFEDAALVSVDGFGDFVSTAWGRGEGKRITIDERVHFPHSMGLFYLAITQYLGFPHYGDEYKVMGLAPYGKPTLVETLREVLKPTEGGRFELGLDHFLHHAEGVSMVWENGEPRIGTVFSPALEQLLGPARKRDEPLTERHHDLAASAQALYEDVFFHVLNWVYAQTKNPRLCLAGGCAMNSVANGKVFDRSPFRQLYVQSAPADSGGAVGAAFSVWNETLDCPRTFVMDHAYWGPSFDEAAIARDIEASGDALKGAEFTVGKLAEDELCRRTAAAIAEGKVVGWFQGRMEWGPRALGNRSIVCDPRRADMKAILNSKIKRRESFRPFAPSIHREAVAEWFETDYDVPFMLQVYPIRAEKRAQIPAVTHVNGSGRLQTVTAEQNSRYYRLIAAFRDLTGVPIVLNTSFNENEPVVCKPSEALACFLRTQMDVLVLGDYFIERRAAESRPGASESETAQTMSGR